jgi:hypothetical protein
MRSGLGQPVVWYMFMNVLEGESRSIFTAFRMIMVVCPETKPLYPPIRLRGPMSRKIMLLDLNSLHFSCIILPFITNQIHTFIRH